MGISSAFYSGVSGLNTNSQAMSVIGNNLANTNTVGFKASRAEFQDIISKSLKGILGGNQIGRGVKIGAVIFEYGFFYLYEESVNEIG